MRKTKLIATVTAMAMMFMGVGYSYWSQAIPIKVSGTLATFEVNVIDAQAFDANGEPMDEALGKAGHQKTSASLTAAQLEGGSVRKYRVIIKNVGSTKAKLEKVVLTKVSGENDLMQYINVKVGEKGPVNVYSRRELDGFGITINPGDSPVSLDIVISVDGDLKLDSTQRSFEITLEPQFLQQ